MSRAKRVAVLIEDQYQDLEVWYPALRLIEAGAEVVYVGREKGRTHNGKYGYPAVADLGFKDARPEDFDAVLVPGGFAPDFMRRSPQPAAFVKAMDAQGKPVASICHGPWLLASAGVLKGRKATCFYAIKDDIVNAGARYEDSELVADGNLITSRKPEDLPAFAKALVDLLTKQPAAAHR